MTGGHMHQLFEAMFSVEELERMWVRCSVLERERTLHGEMLAHGMVISSGPVGVASQRGCLSRSTPTASHDVRRASASGDGSVSHHDSSGVVPHRSSPNKIPSHPHFP
jgi:hypothetical protein